MKHIIMLIVLVGLITVLQAQKSVETIALSFDNPIVTRVVITIDDEVEWSYSINKAAHQVKLTIYNCDPGAAVVNGLDKNYLVKNLDMQVSRMNAEITLTLDGSFLIENSTLSNPFRIVLDLFKYKKPYTYEDLMYEAKFYAKMGKWPDANKVYAQIVREHPDNLDVYYYWGRMLLEQGKTGDAQDKLNAVPQGSSLFRAAQNSLAKLEGSEPFFPEDNTMGLAYGDTLTADADTIAEMSVKSGTIKNKFNFFSIGNYVDFSRYQPIFLKVIRFIKSLPIWFWIILIVVILIIILVVFDIVRFKKHSGSASSKIKVKADNPVKEEMVKKLLIDGWKEKEIARELVLTPKEAALYVKKVKKLESKKTKQ